MLRPYTVPVTLDLLPLLLAALALGIEVDARQLARVVVEDLEPSLARGERTIIEFAGRELPVDPPHHPVGGDPVHLARAGAVGEAVQYVQRALSQVPVKGTAVFPYRGWPFSSIPVAAKTGSAEIVGKQPFSWFASYAPANKPQYVAVAVVEQAGFGSQVAGPVVRRIMDELFHQTPLPIQFGGRSD